MSLKENAKKKVMARAKRTLDCRNGSKSTIRYHIELGMDLDSSSGQLETWRLTHWDEKKGWISSDASAKYVSLRYHISTTKYSYCLVNRCLLYLSFFFTKRKK